MKKGPYTVTSTKIVYVNPWMKVREDAVVRQDGTNGIFGVVEYGNNNGGVSILAMDQNQNIYLIKEYAYAVARYELELPSGGIDENETPLEAAKRELKEEVGLVSDTWIPLGVSNPLTMSLVSPAHLFLALDVRIEGQGEQDIEIVKMAFQDGLNKVKDGTITHAGSLNALFKAKLYFEDNS